MSTHETGLIRDILEELLNTVDLPAYSINRILKAIKHTYELDNRILTKYRKS